MASDTRQKIVLTAMRLFWEKGYGSTSIADVLQAAGVNSGSLYHFFPGKQDLLLAVLGFYLEGLPEMLLAPAWKGVDDPIERIHALLARYRASIVATDATYGCPIGSLALEIHEPDPPVRAALVANFDAWTAAVERCLDDAGPRLPANLDRAALAEFVLTTMEGGVMQARTHRDVRYFDRTIAELRRYLEHLQRDAANGVAPTKPAKPTRPTEPSEPAKATKATKPAKPGRAKPAAPAVSDAPSKASASTRAEPHRPAKPRR